MYPSNSNIHNPMFCIGQAILQKPSLYNGQINLNSKQEDRTSSTFNFSSPYIRNYEDEPISFQHIHDLLLQQQPLTAENTAAEMIADAKNNDVAVLIGKCKKKCQSTTEQMPRKRYSKKDRHSKIQTAKGPRDRRIRLSLDVAPRFFGLQDFLGFDTASRTVEWLLEKSKSAIQEVAGSHSTPMKYSSSFGANSASSTSECEVVSGIDESTVCGNQKAIKISKVKPSSTSTKEKKIRAFRKAAFHPLAKETREKARARARERTREKKRLCESQKCCEEMNHELDRLGSWSAFGTDKESAGSQSQHMNPSFDMLADEELSSFQRQILATTEDITGESLGIPGNWSPFTIFNYQQSSGVLHEHQLTDLQFYDKPLDAYNNMNPC